MRAWSVSDGCSVRHPTNVPDVGNEISKSWRSARRLNVESGTPFCWHVYAGVGVRYNVPRESMSMSRGLFSRSRSRNGHWPRTTA